MTTMIRTGLTSTPRRRLDLLGKLFIFIVSFFSFVLIIQSRILPLHDEIANNNGQQRHDQHTQLLRPPLNDNNNHNKNKNSNKNKNNNKNNKRGKKTPSPTASPVYIPEIPEITDPRDPRYDKDKIMNVLREMQVDPFTIDNATWSLVPTWTEVTNIWGTEPVVHGLNQHCKRFREQVPAKRRRVAVAGMFSTGTNLLAQLLQHNCAIPERMEWLGRAKGHGMEWQVPWGKHNGFRYRGKHSVRDFVNDPRQPKLGEFLPVATVRNPHDWMSSICRHSYTIRWPHNKNNCPNLFNASHQPSHVSVAVGADKNRVEFNSLLDMWNVWNGEYFYAGSPGEPQQEEDRGPAIVVRFEDLVFFPRELTERVCACAGGEIMKPHHVYSDRDHSGGGNFHYVVGSSLSGPGHGRKNPLNGLLESWIKYAKPMEKRKRDFKQTDLEFIDQYLDTKMAKILGYTDMPRDG